MPRLVHPDLIESSELAEKAIGPGFNDSERARWRTLTERLLEVVKNIGPSGSERRRFIRATAALIVEVVSPAELRGLLTSSIGGGGFSIPMADPPAVGTVLEFSIRVPQRLNNISTKVETVWRRPSPGGEFGTAFLYIDNRDRDLLEAIVVKHLLESGLVGY